VKVLNQLNKVFSRRHVSSELVQTERNHLTNLKIMQKIFAQGLRREMNYDLVVDKLFPLIDEHVEFATSFVQKLVERQSDQKVCLCRFVLILTSCTCVKTVKKQCSRYQPFPAHGIDAATWRSFLRSCQVI